MPAPSVEFRPLNIGYTCWPLPISVVSGNVELKLYAGVGKLSLPAIIIDENGSLGIVDPRSICASGGRAILKAL